MISEIDTVKEDIYEMIADIKDENVLNSIKVIIENIQAKTTDETTNKRDLTGYIKEWVKNM